MPALVAGIHVATIEARPKRSAVPSISAVLPGVDGRDIGERSDAVFDGFARP